MHSKILDCTRVSWQRQKLKLAPKCVDKGMSIQEIAEFLELDAEIIKKYLQEQS
jgi:predicted transcriptional regulator